MLQKNRCYSMKTNLWDTDKQGQIIIECISFKNKNHSWDTVWQTRADYRIHKFKKKHGWDTEFDKQGQTIECIGLKTSRDAEFQIC